MSEEKKKMNSMSTPVTVIARVTRTDLDQDGIGNTTDSYTIASVPLEAVGGYVVPVDPMDDLGCDSCQ